MLYLIVNLFFNRRSIDRPFSRGEQLGYGLLLLGSALIVVGSLFPTEGGVGRPFYVGILAIVGGGVVIWEHRAQ